MRPSHLVLTTALIGSLTMISPALANDQQRRGGNGTAVARSSPPSTPQARPAQPRSSPPQTPQARPAQPRSSPPPTTQARPAQPRSSPGQPDQARPAQPRSSPGQPDQARRGQPRPGPGRYYGGRPYSPYRGVALGGAYWGLDYFSLTWGHPRWWFPWGYGPYWYGPYWYGDYGDYGYYGGYGDNSSVKFDVRPKETSVFVDGYYAGVAADYGGWFQSLDVSAGPHVITLWNQGYRSVTQNVYLEIGQQLKLRHDMVRLAADEQQEPRPTPPPVAPEPPERQARPARPAPPQWTEPAPPSRIGDSPDYSRLTIRVQPAGAQVLIDNEAWQTSPDAERLIVHLPVGTHHIEVRKDGFKTFKTDVQIRAGETTALNVSLTGQD